MRLLCALLAAVPAFAATCDSLVSLAIPNTTIATAEDLPAGSFTPPGGRPIPNLPSFCRVAGTIKPSADSDIQFVIADGPEAGRCTGRADLAPSLQDFENAWDEYHSRVEEYRELDDGVLVLTYATGRGKASGVEIGERRANLFQLHDGKVTSLVVYWDRMRALADAGLAHAA